MSDIALRVEAVGKRYRLGPPGGGRYYQYKSLRDSLGGLAKHPLMALRRDPMNDANSFWALNDVSFEVKKGEVVGIIGRNGAGKSTLLKILSRITKPTKGHVALYGRVGSLLEVGTGFHPELSGRENIYLNGAILGMTRAEVRAKFDEIVAFSEIEQFLDTPVKQYSSGMYMRLAFAVAAHLEPEILVVDEVLAVGDVDFQKKCLGKMEQVAKGGRTVLFVSHNMNAIETLCRQIVYLHAGQLRQVSFDVRQTLARYMSPESNDGSRQEWRNPGNSLENPWFRPSHFYLGDAKGEVMRMPIANNEPVYIYVKGDSKERDAALTIGYALFDSAGLLLYWSTTNDCTVEEWPKVGLGSSVLRSQVPPRFLNEGTYRVALMISLHFRQMISDPSTNAPFIELSIRGGLSDSPYWMHRRPGLLAPVCEWTAEQL